MKHLIIGLCAALAMTAQAATLAPADVSVKADPAVTVKVTPRKGNTSKTIAITVNVQDRVSANGAQIYPVPPPPPDMTHMGPAIDMASIPAPVAGYATARVRSVYRNSSTGLDCDPAGPLNPALGQDGKPTTCTIPPGMVPVNDPTLGAFRDPCTVAKYLKDDPLVLPGQPGKSHLHTFFGNAGIDAFSTQETLSTKRASTCAGGTLFATAMWVPTMIDEIGHPVPFALNYYQKGSYNFDISKTVVPIPAGLRMVVGDPKNTDPTKGGALYSCIGPDNKGGAWQHTITRAIADGAHCVAGGTFYMSVIFPNCWDGVNLDSPDHRSHMSTVVQDQTAPFAKHCPATHPVPIAVISYQMTHKLTATDHPEKWWLSSDMDMTKEPGVSGHGDYWANVDEATEAVLTQKCIREKRDCHDYLLGDGRTLF